MLRPTCALLERSCCVTRIVVTVPNAVQRSERGLCYRSVTGRDVMLRRSGRQLLPPECLATRTQSKEMQPSLRPIFPAVSEEEQEHDDPDVAAIEEQQNFCPRTDSSTAEGEMSAQQEGHT